MREEYTRGYVAKLFGRAAGASGVCLGSIGGIFLFYGSININNKLSEVALHFCGNITTVLGQAGCGNLTEGMKNIGQVIKGEWIVEGIGTALFIGGIVLEFYGRRKHRKATELVGQEKTPTEQKTEVWGDVIESMKGYQ